jgi:hypothetical protein
MFMVAVDRVKWIALLEQPQREPRAFSNGMNVVRKDSAPGSVIPKEFI